MIDFEIEKGRVSSKTFFSGLAIQNFAVIENNCENRLCSFEFWN